MIICYLRKLWRTFYVFMVNGVSVTVEGHDFVEQKPEIGQPSFVFVLKCETCGFVSVSWNECLRCGYKGEGK